MPAMGLQAESQCESASRFHAAPKVLMVLSWIEVDISDLSFCFPQYRLTEISRAK